MASNMACVGLDVADVEGLNALLHEVWPRTTVVGEVDGLVVRRWEDASGARIVLAGHDGAVERFMPSFAGVPGAFLRDVFALNDEVSAADVVVDGETRTRLAIELEERDLVRGRPVAGEASIVLLGTGVEVFADEAAFMHSPASLLTPGSEPEGDPPPHLVELGIAWPMRVAAESFVSMGLFSSSFGGSGTATAEARMAGIVLATERRAVEVTGQSFVVARVHCTGFEADLCLPAPSDGSVPAPGNVIAGDVFVVGSLRVDDARGRGPSPATALETPPERPSQGIRTRIGRLLGRDR